MSFTVRSKAAWQQMQDDKFGGMAQGIEGMVSYVVPGASATHGPVVRSYHGTVYNDLNTAYAATVTGRGDAIVVCGGAHTLTAALAASKDNVSVYGIEAWLGLKVQKPRSIVTAFAANKGITVTGANNSFIGLTCIPITAKSFFDFSVAADGLKIKNCYVDMTTPAVNIATVGIAATGAASNVEITGTTFVSDGAQGPAIDATATLGGLIDGNVFVGTTGSWAVCILTGAGTAGLQITNNNFNCYGTAITAPVSGTGADITGGVALYRNLFGVLCTVPIDNYSAVGLAELGLNYKATVGAGTGGTLVSVNT